MYKFLVWVWVYICLFVCVYVVCSVISKKLIEIGTETLVEFEQPYLARQKCNAQYSDHIKEAVSKYCDKYWKNYSED